MIDVKNSHFHSYYEFIVSYFTNISSTLLRCCASFLEERANTHDSYSPRRHNSLFLNIFYNRKASQFHLLLRTKDQTIDLCVGKTIFSDFLDFLTPIAINHTHWNVMELLVGLETCSPSIAITLGNKQVRMHCTGTANKAIYCYTECIESRIFAFHIWLQIDVFTSWSRSYLSVKIST